MRILETGRNGMVGVALREVFKDHEMVFPEKYKLNVGNINQVMKFASQKFDAIIHLCAETDHEYCEENPSNCYYINTIGTGNMVRLAEKLNVPIVYVSAGSIFDGAKTSPYNSWDKPNPLNHYNTSKWYGEVIVRGYEKHYILRAGWMFGGGRNIDKKFVRKIIEKIERGETHIKVCDDCVGSPTYSIDLAECIKDVLEGGGRFGTYHAVNKSDGVSRYEFAQRIVEYLGLERKVAIIPCKIDDLKDEFPCKRTNYEVLNTDFNHIRDWKEALKDYIYANYRH